MTNRKNKAFHRTPGRKKILGISMIEAMFGMAVLAIATVAGVIAFGEVATRQASNQLLTGMQGFNVDTKLYLDTAHDNTMGDAPLVVGWATTTVPTGTISCAYTPASCDSTTSGGTACSAKATGAAASCPAPAQGKDGMTVPHSNWARVFNFPSVKIADSDGDGTPDLHIAYGQGEGIRMGMMMSPLTETTLEAALGSVEWNHCAPFRGASGSNPIAFALQLAIEDLDICNTMDKTISRYDHVRASACSDKPASTAVSNWPEGKAAAMNICYAAY